MMTTIPRVSRSIVTKACAAFTVVLIGLMLGRPAWSATEPTFTLDPNGVTPLAGVVELTTDNPVSVTLVISDGTETWAVAFPEQETGRQLSR